MSEWITTNGFDAIYYLSDGSRLEITEQDDASWALTHFVGSLALATFADPDRFPLMRRAKEYWRALNLRTVASPEQRAEPWFKGDDFDYLADPERDGRRQFANGLSVITAEDRAARVAAIKAENAAEAKRPLFTTVDQQTAKALELNALARVEPKPDDLALKQAEFLNNLMRPAEPEYTCSNGHSPNRYAGGPTCPECGSWGSKLNG